MGPGFESPLGHHVVASCVSLAATFLCTASKSASRSLRCSSSQNRRHYGRSMPRRQLRHFAVGSSVLFLSETISKGIRRGAGVNDKPGNSAPLLPGAGESGTLFPQRSKNRRLCASPNDFSGTARWETEPRPGPPAGGRIPAGVICKSLPLSLINKSICRLRKTSHFESVCRPMRDSLIYEAACLSGGSLAGAHTGSG